jgi:hypothetical protein
LPTRLKDRTFQIKSCTVSVYTLKTEAEELELMSTHENIADLGSDCATEVRACMFITSYRCVPVKNTLAEMRLHLVFAC